MVLLQNYKLVVIMKKKLVFCKNDAFLAGCIFFALLALPCCKGKSAGTAPDREGGFLPLDHVSYDEIVESWLEPSLNAHYLWFRNTDFYDSEKEAYRMRVFDGIGITSGYGSLECVCIAGNTLLLKTNGWIDADAAVFYLLLEFEGGDYASAKNFTYTAGYYAVPKG